jgi:hypothetical protein
MDILSVWIVASDGNVLLVRSEHAIVCTDDRNVVSGAEPLHVERIFCTVGKYV